THRGSLTTQDVALHVASWPRAPADYRRTERAAGRRRARRHPPSHDGPLHSVERVARRVEHRRLLLHLRRTLSTLAGRGADPRRVCPDARAAEERAAADARSRARGAPTATIRRADDRYAGWSEAGRDARRAADPGRRRAHARRLRGARRSRQERAEPGHRRHLGAYGRTAVSPHRR